MSIKIPCPRSFLTAAVTLAALPAMVAPALAAPDASGRAALKAQVAKDIPAHYPRALSPEKKAAPVGPRVLVRFADGHETREKVEISGSLASVLEQKSAAGDASVTPTRHGRFHVVQLAGGEKAGRDAAEALAETLRRQPGVLWAEVDGTVSADVVPNEFFYDNFGGVATDLQKWYFDGIGSDRNINAEAAWDVQTGRGDVQIAIIDSGTDWFYNDLFENLVVNTGEVAGDGLDNDGNGFVDDVLGWDFIDGDADATAFPWGDGLDNDGDGIADDGVFHGTFVASVAVGVGNNGTNSVGACWNCGLIPVRALDDENNGPFSAVADAIYYAVDRGADVINLSLGGGTFSFALFDAVSYARRQNVVVVASAGNANTSAPQYPASIGGVIGVGATDSGSVLLGGSGDIDGRAGFSNWGPNTTVVAPGTDLIGIFPGSVAAGTAGTASINSASGTSFSAPLVTGLAGLVLSQGLDGGEHFRWSLVYSIITSTAADLPDDGDDVPNAGPGWDGAGRVDFVEALDLADLLAW